MRKNRIFLAAMVTAGMVAGCQSHPYERIQTAASETETAVVSIYQNGQGETGSSDNEKHDPETGLSGNEKRDPETGLFGNEKRDPGPVELVIESESETKPADIVISQEAEDGSGADQDMETKSEALTEGGSDRPYTLLFAGDVLLSDHVLNAYEKAGDISGVVDANYRQAINEADFFMVNQEFPFSSRGTAAADKQYTFRLPPERVSLFQELGIDGVTLANNHALDYGQEALLDSCQILDQAGILHTGAGADLDAAKQAFYLSKGDPKEEAAEASFGRTAADAQWKIAVIGATRVIPETGWAAGIHHPGMLATYDPSVLLEEIRQHSEAGELVIVYVHWGIERDEMPQEYQRNLARQYIDAGADLVIGAHPHVLQGIEYYQGRAIVYSLGNFIFGSSIPRTMLLEVTVPTGDEGGREAAGAKAESSEIGDAAESTDATESADAAAGQDSLQLRLLPGTSAAGYTRMYTDEAERQKFFQYLESISFDVTIDPEGLVSPQP